MSPRVCIVLLALAAVGCGRSSGSGSKGPGTGSTGSREPPPDAASTAERDADQVPRIEGLDEFEAIVQRVCVGADTRPVRDFFYGVGMARPGWGWPDFHCFSRMGGREVVYFDIRRVDVEVPLGPVRIWRIEWFDLWRKGPCQNGSMVRDALEILSGADPSEATRALYWPRDRRDAEVEWKDWRIRRTTSRVETGEFVCRVVLEYKDSAAAELEQ